MMDLAGKDYFTVAEAAHYCGCSLSQFKAKIKGTPLQPGRMFGKTLYRRSDLQKLIEETAWQPSNGGPTAAMTAASRRPHISNGRRGANNAARV